MKNNDERILYKLYSTLLEMRTLPCSNQDQLEDLGNKIMELDAYYAGLALTASQGGKINLGHLYDIGELNRQLIGIQITNTEDEHILNCCQKYLDTFNQINLLLHSISTKKTGKCSHGES